MNSDDQQTPDTSSESKAKQSFEKSQLPSILRSEDLLQGKSEIWIEHGDEMYRLRLTASGKLYLTK